MTNNLRKNCDILGISFESLDNISIRAVILAYKKEALKVHPDKLGEDATEEDVARATTAFQDLNNAYGMILNLVLQKAKDREDQTTAEDDINCLINDGERFMRDNFKNCNFPHENSGSFTVGIQNVQANSWQECLERVYGQPHVNKNDKGTECDRFWKFEYKYEEHTTEITLHIYNKPKTKKSSKLLIQGGSQSLICLFVFSELPRIYKDVSNIEELNVVTRGNVSLRSICLVDNAKSKQH